MMSLRDEFMGKGDPQRIASKYRDLKTRRFSGEKSLSNSRCRISGSNSPPPLSQSMSTCTSSTSSSPPGSPIPSSSTRVPLAVQTSEKCLTIKPNNGLSQGRQSPTFLSRSSRPPIVSMGMPQSPSKSWDEGDEHPDQNRGRSQVANINPTRLNQHSIPFTRAQSDPTGNSPIRPRYNLNPRLSSSGITPSLFGDTCSSEDAELRSIGSQNDQDSEFLQKRRVPSPCHYSDHRPPTPTNTFGTGFTQSTLPTTAEDDVSSLGGIEDSVVSSGPSLMRLIFAIRSNSNRPTNLTVDEKTLWDAVQAAKKQARQDGIASCTSKKSPDRSASNNESRAASLSCAFEQKCEAQELALKQQKENSESLLAIQRVLADVQAERDKAVEQLTDLRQNSIAQFSFCPGDLIDSLADHQQQEEMDTLKQELDKANARVDRLEKSLVLAQTSNEKGLQNQSSHSNHTYHQSVSPSVRQPSLDVSQLMSSSNESIGQLRNELVEKSMALENAKMIITSLEKASNTLAAELRGKLRAKDDECTYLKKELNSKQGTLEMLASELRDVQCNRPSHFCDFDLEHSRRLAISSRLEKNMAEFRAASVVLESTQDPSTLHSLGDLLADSLCALKEGISVIDDYSGSPSYGDKDSFIHTGMECLRCRKSQGETRRLLSELDDARNQTRQLEDRLQKHKDEIKRLRLHAEAIRRQRDDDVHALQAEIKILRQQCSTNMEVLTRKERELAVLRDSLQVEDVGYISDDNSEGDDEVSDSGTRPSALTSGQYGPSQAEALATLLAQGGNHSFDSGKSGAVVRDQIESLKKELTRVQADYDKVVRELKVDKESLSNAKMIISSLERANKSMMEDLRSRLQDSNSAIACLLEKSLESEKTSSRLRAELEDALQRERERSFDDPTFGKGVVHDLVIVPLEPIETID